jgi:serine/threonine protein kinase
MAQKLSEWLLYLHAVNWLHKGLRSANVLFVGTPQDHDQLFVSGYEYSRLSKGDHTTTGPSSTDESLAWYIHPNYLGSKRGLGFRKTYDMYSLGIILIELAYWKPIQKVYSESLARSQSSGQAQSGADHLENEAQRGPSVASISISDIEKLRSRMLSPENSPELDILSRIEEIAGTRYYRATRACIEGMEAFDLAGNLEQTDPTVGAHIQRAFVEVVVDSLKGIVV